MKRGEGHRAAHFVLLLGCAIGCGGPTPAHVLAPLASGAATVGHAPPHDVEPAALLARTDDDADVLLRLSVARTHPLGPKLEPFVLAWPGWGSTLRRFTAHPISELDWIDIVGPRDTAKERLAARTVADDALIDSRLAAGGDGTLRLTQRPATHLVTAVPPDAADALTAQLRDARVVDPADDAPGHGDEGLRARMPHPHEFFHVIPEDAQTAVLRVWARPAGAAEAELTLMCADHATAGKVANAMREQAEHVNGMVVRMLTHDLLSGLAVHAEGAVAKLSLPASREQLEALAALAAGFIPPPAP